MLANWQNLYSKTLSRQWLPSKRFTGRDDERESKRSMLSAFLKDEDYSWNIIIKIFYGKLFLIKFYE